MKDGRAGGLRLENVEAHVEEKVHVDGIKSLVKGNCLQVKKDFDDFGAPDPHIDRLLNQVVLVRGKIDPEIFKILF